MELNHPLERTIKTITYNGIAYDIVKRKEVLWVGCLDYARNNRDESDGDATLSRFQQLLGVEKRELVNPAWSAALWLNYDTDEKPCGLMFAQETYSDKQDSRYELITQPAGLWLRIRRSKETSLAMFGSESIDAWD